MKTILILMTIFMGIFAQAQVTDAKLVCHNLKGETVNNNFYRLDKNKIKLFENGGFAFQGQRIILRTKRVGLIPRHVNCSADFESKSVELITCATGSSIEFMNEVLPAYENSDCR